MEKNNYEEEIHYCPLRDKNIEDGDCFETVMAILGMNAKSYNKKIREQYPNCEEVCSKCQFNKEKEE